MINACVHNEWNFGQKLLSLANKIHHILHDVQIQTVFETADVDLMLKLFTIIAVFLLSGPVKAEVSNRSLLQNQLTDSVIIIKNNSRITSIQQMLKPFEGKPVFVFLWINKCNPCLKEFSFKNSLKKYLDAEWIKGNNIYLILVFSRIPYWDYTTSPVKIILRSFDVYVFYLIWWSAELLID